MADETFGRKGYSVGTQLTLTFKLLVLCYKDFSESTTSPQFFSKRWSSEAFFLYICDQFICIYLYDLFFVNYSFAITVGMAHLEALEMLSISCTNSASNTDDLSDEVQEKVQSLADKFTQVYDSDDGMLVSFFIVLSYLWRLMSAQLPSRQLYTWLVTKYFTQFSMHQVQCCNCYRGRRRGTWLQWRNRRFCV